MGLSMGLSRRVCIALFAVLTELVAVAATGNQGVTNFVADHMATSPLGDLFLRSLPSFPWRFSTEARPGATTILVSQYAAIATLFVLTFLLMLIVVRGAPTFSGPFFSSLGSVLFAALVAHMVANVIDYDWDGRALHKGLGRFGYALFNSNDGLSIMFALMCGVVVAIVVGVVGVFLRRRVPEVDEPPLFTSSLGSPLENAGFGPADAYNPPTQPWQTQESYEPAQATLVAPATASYAPESYAPPSYAPHQPAPAADADPTLASYGSPSPAADTAAASTAPPAGPTAGPPAWVPPPEPHPSFAYPPTYHSEPLPPVAPADEPDSRATVEPVPEASIDEMPPEPVPVSEAIDEPARSEATRAE